MVTVARAKAIARSWVEETGSTSAGFAGAFFTGSIASLPDSAVLPACSDVDVKVVVAGESLPDSPGKIPVDNVLENDSVLLDVSHVKLSDLAQPEKVLVDFQLANAFRTRTIIADPTGTLGELTAYVEARFASRPAVLERCAQAHNAVSRWLRGMTQATELHDRVTACVFASGATAHIILVAGLWNPTVRRRYANCSRLLESYGEQAVRERLLRTLGAVEVTAAQAANHLAEAGEAFDFACSILTSPYRFASDITRHARPIAIGGSLEMIEEGRHREAMYWLVTVYSRCRAVVSADQPLALPGFDAGYWRLLRTLGFHCVADLAARALRIRDDLDEVWRTAVSIVDRNPEVR